MIKKRQYNEKRKQGDKPMSDLKIWQPPESVEWESKRGQFKNKSDGMTATNTNASEKPLNGKLTKEHVMKTYAKYLQNARQSDGNYDWTEWNAKRLVWDLGNHKTLAAIRNTVSDFSDTLGVKLTTLRAGNAKKAMTVAQKKETYSTWLSSEMLEELAASD